MNYLELIGEVQLELTRLCDYYGNHNSTVELLCKVTDALPQLLLDRENLKENFDEISRELAALRADYEGVLAANSLTLAIHDHDLQELDALIPDKLRAELAPTDRTADLVFEAFAKTIPAWCHHNNVPLEWSNSPDDYGEEEALARNDEAAGEQVVIEQSME